jgi:putative transposase
MLYIEPVPRGRMPTPSSSSGASETSCYKREVFASLLEAKVLVEEHRKHYNERRPHSSLGDRTPVEFAVACESADMGTGFTKDLQSATTLS